MRSWFSLDCWSPHAQRFIFAQDKVAVFVGRLCIRVLIWSFNLVSSGLAANWLFRLSLLVAWIWILVFWQFSLWKRFRLGRWFSFGNGFFRLRSEGFDDLNNLWIRVDVALFIFLVVTVLTVIIRVGVKVESFSFLSLWWFGVGNDLFFEQTFRGQNCSRFPQLRSALTLGLVFVANSFRQVFENNVDGFGFLLFRKFRVFLLLLLSWIIDSWFGWKTREKTKCKLIILSRKNIKSLVFFQ